MFAILGKSMNKLRWLLPAVAVAMLACTLDVSDPSVVREEELAGPSSVPTTIAGVIGDLTDATEEYVLYTSLFTDEMILAGTFPSRLQVDERRIQRSNVSLDNVNEQFHVARRQADKMASDFEGFLGNEDFDQDDLREGIAIGKYVGALARLKIGFLYCQSPIENGGDALSTDQIASRALGMFEEAEAAAGEAGLAEWQDAAILGQARAHLWLGEYGDAGADAARVDRSHRLFVEHSNNNPDQFNKIFGLTWGNQNDVIRWTVGAGLGGQRGGEKFRLFDKFVDLEIIDPDPGLTAFQSDISVHAQRIYDANADDILLSNGLYPRLIEAEVAIRQEGNGLCTTDPAVDCEAPGEAIINDVRSDWQQRWTAEQFRVDAALGTIDDRSQEVFGDDFEDVTFRQKMLLVSDEIARETWLSGVRQETLRRFVREFGERENTPDGETVLDLYPVKENTEDQECFPIPEQEDTGAQPQ